MVLIRRIRLAFKLVWYALRYGRVPDSGSEWLEAEIHAPDRKAWVLWQYLDDTTEIAYNGASVSDARRRYEQGVALPNVLGAKFNVDGADRASHGTLREAG